MLNKNFKDQDSSKFTREGLKNVEYGNAFPFEYSNTTKQTYSWIWLEMEKQNRITCLFCPSIEKELCFLSQKQLKQLDGNEELENLISKESQLPIGIIDWPKANNNFKKLKETLNIDDYSYVELKDLCLQLLKQFSKSKWVSKIPLETIDYSKLLSTGSGYISEDL